jgi:hypothetical protein
MAKSNGVRKLELSFSPELSFREDVLYFRERTQSFSLSSSEKSVAKTKAGRERRAAAFLYDEDEDDEDEEEEDCDWEVLVCGRLLLDLSGAVNVFVTAL